MSSSWRTLAVFLALVAGCRREPHAERSVPPPLASRAAPSAAPPNSPAALVEAGKPRTRTFAPPRAGERIAVAASRFTAGSLPGDEGREPKMEPVGLTVSLSPYEIDRLPFPNDPAEPPRTDVPQKEAARLCAARGQRLCSELEWENACRGPGGETYAGGEAWDPTCSRNPAACGSAYGVLGMGALREWTSSDFVAPDKDEKNSVAVRGAAPTAEPTEHRCARRSALAPTVHAHDLGFRCCSGAGSSASIPALRMGTAVRKLALEPAQLAEVFATMPQLAALQPPFRFFVEPDDMTTVLKGGKSGQGPPVDPEGYTLTAGPVLWTPAPGEEIAVVLGHTVKDSFIVALYRLPDDRWRLASSLLFMNDLGPFALAYRAEVRERLLWSSCWKCAGEGGAVSLRDGHRVIIVQQ